MTHLHFALQTAVARVAVVMTGTARAMTITITTRIVITITNITPTIIIAIIANTAAMVLMVGVVEGGQQRRTFTEVAPAKRDPNKSQEAVHVEHGFHAHGFDDQRRNQHRRNAAYLMARENKAQRLRAASQRHPPPHHRLHSGECDAFSEAHQCTYDNCNAVRRVARRGSEGGKQGPYCRAPAQNPFGGIQSGQVPPPKIRY
mmetsp:Transcript_15626/g.27958  ORF Transcript_15626/g.27958 Transcript_15626/m.27958 type:complete len:202 (+) Transcript_15626:1264-1869(+)